MCFISFRQCNKFAMCFAWWVDDKWGLQKCVHVHSRILRSTIVPHHFFLKGRIFFITARWSHSCLTKMETCYKERTLIHKRLFLVFPKNVHKKWRHAWDTILGTFSSQTLCILSFFNIARNLWYIINIILKKFPLGIFVF